MKKILILTMIFGVVSSNALAYRYSFDSIPDPLRKNANAVVRTNQTVYELISIGKLKTTHKEAVTILNENADYLRCYVINYSSLLEISNIKASVYDRNGNLTDIVSHASIQDVDATSGLVSDDRIKRIIFPKLKYPFTIEIEYSTTENGLISLPSAVFQQSTDVSVEQYGVQYIIPENIKFHYREFYLRNKADSTCSDGKKIYTWIETGIPAFRKWYFTSLMMDHRPKLLVAVDRFSYAGVEGSMDSWKSLGQWDYKMIEGLDQLPESEVARIKSMVAGVTSDREKVKILYKYMQSRTRYVSIQLGVGGIKPFPASFVSEKGYGDCKALSNYMHAILRAAGINSYNTLALSGINEDIIPDFVSFQFDHCILCVPLEKETIWLECTSQTLPFNYLSSFTANRNVLLITPEGGRLERTPVQLNNYLKTTGTIDIKRYNESIGELKMKTCGLFYDESMEYLKESEDEVKKDLDESMPFGTFTVSKAGFTNVNDENPYSLLDITVKIRDYASFTNKRLYFYPCLDRMDFVANDSLGLKIYDTMSTVDSITYNFPHGYDPEFLPEDINIKNEYGSFYRKLNYSDGRVVAERAFTLNKGVYKSNESPDFYEFIRKVAAADHQKVILVLKSNL